MSLRFTGKVTYKILSRILKKHKKVLRSGDCLINPAIIRGVSIPELEMSNSRFQNLGRVTFESAIIERYKRREISVEEAMVEMYLAGVSVRRVEDITEALWGTKVSPGTISNLNKKIYEGIEKWRNLPLKNHYSYVYLDGIWMKRSWGVQVKNVSVLVAIGVNGEGFREILGVSEGAKEDKESWAGFLRYLKKRGLEKIDLVISDKSLGLMESIVDFYPRAQWQRCIVHYYRNVLALVPRGREKEVATMLKENLEEARLLNLFAPVRRRPSTLSIGNVSELITVFDKNHERDPRKDTCHQLFSGWRVSSDVGCRQVATYCRFDMERA